MIQDFRPIFKVSGELNLPGDKSISHRSVMFASLADGQSKIYNCLQSEDVLSTINAFRKMGCEIEIGEEKIVIIGRGIDGLSEPEGDLYLGNSGTTTRLIAGILSAQKFPTKLTGDPSLSSRPMKRIIDPLIQMGAKINSKSGFLPLEIYPVNSLESIEYKLPIASAQIKSCVLLAGLFQEKETVVEEYKRSRNHTEKMLQLKIIEGENSRKIYSSQDNFPTSETYYVPSDISTASFFIILALLLKDSELRLPKISLNESRIGILDVLSKMGGNIKTENVETLNGEERGDIIVKSSQLRNIEITAEIIPNIIDEIPILSIAGIFAEGDFIIRNAKELRVKESDRIKSVCENMKLIGVDLEEFEDGFRLFGTPKDEKVQFNSFDDHRIAMAFAILSLILKRGGEVKNFECVNISNPTFITQITNIS